MGTLLNRRRYMGGGKKENPYAEYMEQYLTFEALESGTFTLFMDRACGDRTVSYSIDGGETWVDTNHVYYSTSKRITTPSLNAGDKVIWKCISSNGAFSESYGAPCNFSSTGNCNIYGNILSLVYGDNFIGKDSITDGYQTFRGNFKSGMKCVSAENLIIPISVIKQSVCINLFQNNTIVEKGPVIISSDIQSQALNAAFSGCTSLASLAILADTVNTSQNDWARNVPSGGVLTKKSGATWNLLPTGWTINYISI